MVLIVISNALLLGIEWFCNRWRQNRYTDIMNRTLNRMSLLIQRSKFQRPEAATILKNSLAKLEKEMLLKDEYLSIHEMKSWAVVDLSSWVTYRYSIPNINLSTNHYHILLEAVQCDQNGKHDDCANSVGHDLSNHILTFGMPVAWRLEEPYAVVMTCDDMNSLVRMVDAFGQRRLLVSGFEVTCIATVQTTGSPQAVSLSREIFSPAGETGEELHSFIPSDPETSKETCQQRQDSSHTVKKSEQSKTQSESTSSVPHSESKDSGDDSSAAENKSESKEILKAHSKPPNILIYCGVKDTKRKFEEASESIRNCVNTDSYTIYHLKQEHILTTPWQDNTALLVISSCPRLQPDVEKKLSEFVFNHQGSLLSFGSSADNIFTNYFDTVKNIKNESVTTFDFQSWKSVSSCCGQLLYSNLQRGAILVIPVSPETSSNENDAHVIRLNPDKGGTIVLSQLLLEQDPVTQAKDKVSFDLLKKSNFSRLSVLQELLALIGLDTNHASPPALSSCHLMAQNKSHKESFLGTVKSRLQNGILKSKTMSLSFQSEYSHGSKQSQTQPLPNLLPVLTHTDDAHSSSMAFEYFDVTEYWRHLKTSKLGQVVLYTDVITSTMPVFDGILFSLPKDLSPVAIAGRQVQGKGRAGNAWLSPSGCAMFTLSLCLQLHSDLGEKIPFLQHMVSLAVVQGVIGMPGYQDLDLRLKWPNDIYYGKEMKLGGVMVLTTVMANNIHATIGCGVNVANSDPTICINDIIRLHNTSKPDLSPLRPLTTGQVIAQTLTSLELLLNDFETKGHNYVSQLYCQRWLHGGSKVRIELETSTEGEIVGLDENGFLSVDTKEEGLISVQPDGNSFDMMHNLISFKTR